ncbi:MAG: hypothetical protein SGJ02_12620 [bacterium]|nr:hypothetical protein [bacterium]
MFKLFYNYFRHASLVSTCFLSLVICCTSCSTIKKDTLPVWNEVSPNQAKSIIQNLTLRSKKISSLKTLARAKLKRGKDIHSVRYVLAANNKGAFHMQALPINGAYAMAILKSDGQKALYLDTAPEIAYLGEVNESSLEKAMGLPLNQHDLIYILTGSLPLRIINEFSDNLKVMISELGDRFFIIVGREKEVYEFDAKTYRLKSLKLRDPFKERDLFVFNLDQEFSEEFAIKKAFFDIPEANVHAELIFSNTEVNKPISSELFSQKVPKGWQEKAMD